MFKNLTVLKTPIQLNIDEDNLRKNLEQLSLIILPSKKVSYGFVSVKDSWQELLHRQNNLYWLNVRVHTRRISKDRLEDAVKERCEQLVDLGEWSDVDDIDKDTLKDIAEAMEFMLLPNTTNYSNKNILICVDIETGLVYIDTPNKIQSDLVSDLLQTAIGVEGITFNKVSIPNLSETVTKLLTEDSLPDPIEWGEKIVLVDDDTKQKGILDKQYIHCTECEKMIQSGKSFKEGKFIYDGLFQFTLTDDFIFKGINFERTIEGEDEDDTFMKTLDYVGMELGSVVSGLLGKWGDKADNIGDVI